MKKLLISLPADEMSKYIYFSVADPILPGPDPDPILPGPDPDATFQNSFDSGFHALGPTINSLHL